MRVLVTGGAGYIGSVVVEALLARGHRVVVLDDLSTGHADAVPDGAPLVVGDLLQTATCEALLRAHAVEAVVHMASLSLVGESVREPARYRDHNVGGARSLLDAMAACDVRALVFSSSAAVYAPTHGRLDESAPLGPTNPYGETKRDAEALIARRASAGALRATSLRYFNAAGASATRGERHDPETHLIPRVLDAALGRHAAVDLFGDDYPTRDGSCVRDYVHVLDLAEAHVRAIDLLAAGRALPAAINLGCGAEGYTVREVIARARAVTGREIAVRVGARREGDPAALVASIGLAERELGWRPTRGLDAMIASAWRLMT